MLAALHDPFHTLSETMEDWSVKPNAASQSTPLSPRSIPSIRFELDTVDGGVGLKLVVAPGNATRNKTLLVL